MHAHIALFPISLSTLLLFMLPPSIINNEIQIWAIFNNNKLFNNKLFNNYCTNEYDDGFSKLIVKTTR